ncbi:YppG family protein [Alkalihalobacterium elongatum]|uniref:YppG family protein n=1 Tax=Alkalihalobacterium elongatum TaxID=2675466 RepID=UPI001C1F721D|nr:YppG family protein [Alkalihalobacterium elongatum]
MFPFGRRNFGGMFGNHPSGFNPFSTNPMGFNPFDYSNQQYQQQNPFQSGFFNSSPFQSMQQPPGFGQQNPSFMQQLMGQQNPGPMMPFQGQPNVGPMNSFNPQQHLGPGQHPQGLQSLFKNDKGQYDLAKIGTGVQQVMGVVNQVSPLMKMFMK